MRKTLITLLLFSSCMIMACGKQDAHVDTTKIKEATPETVPKITSDQSLPSTSSEINETIIESEENAMIFKTEQEMSVSDTNTFSEKEAGLTPTVIAMDGIAVVVNNDNPTDELSSDQVKSIFTGDVLTWDEALQ